MTQVKPLLPTQTKLLANKVIQRKLISVKIGVLFVSIVQLLIMLKGLCSSGMTAIVDDKLLGLAMIFRLTLVKKCIF